MTNPVPANGKHFSLKELQGFVGGYIQMVRSGREPGWVVCDEEGKLRGGPDGGPKLVNRVATIRWLGDLEVYPDVLVGPVLFCGPNQVR